MTKIEQLHLNSFYLVLSHPQTSQSGVQVVGSIVGKVSADGVNFAARLHAGNVFRSSDFLGKSRKYAEFTVFTGFLRLSPEKRYFLASLATILACVYV